MDDNMYEKREIGRKQKSAMKKRYSKKYTEFRVYADGIGYLTGAISEDAAYRIAASKRKDTIYSGIKIKVETVKN